jgi:hypothetical protein
MQILYKGNFVFVLTLLFFVVYFPPLKFLLLSPEYILIFLGFFWTVLYFHKFKKAFLTKPIFIYFVVQIFIIIYALVVDFYYQNSQYIGFEKLYYMKQFRFFINSSFISLVISTYLNYKKWSVNKLINGFVLIGIIQSFFSTVMLISPFFKISILDMLNLDFMLEAKEGEILYRVFGISSEYLFTMPVFQGFVLMIIFLQIVQKQYQYLLFTPFLVISIVFNARIGLIAIPIIMTVYLVYVLFQNNRVNLLLKYSNIVLLILVFLFVSVYLSIKIVGIEIFEFILFRGIDSDGMSGDHLDTLFNKMVFLPSTILGYVFGEGRYLFENRYDEPSDVGYINDLLFGGFLYIIVYIGNWQRLMFIKAKSYDRNYYILVTASFLLILICNYKGPIFQNNGFLRALLILIFLNILNEKNESNRGYFDVRIS